MGKQYQTSDVEASTLGLTIPKEVTVALAEIAHSATEACWRCRLAPDCRSCRP